MEEYSDTFKDWHDLTCEDTDVKIWAKSRTGEWSLTITTAISGTLQPVRTWEDVDDGAFSWPS